MVDWSDGRRPEMPTPVHAVISIKKMVEEALLEVQEALVELGLRLSFAANDERDAPHAPRYVKALMDSPARVPHALERGGLLPAPSLRLMFSPATSHQ